MAAPVVARNDDKVPAAPVAEHLVGDEPLVHGEMPGAAEATDAVEARLRDSFQYRDIEGEDSVNKPKAREGKVPAKPIEDSAPAVEQPRQRTLKELQDAMAEFDSDELTQMLNSAYGRGQRDDD